MPGMHPTSQTPSSLPGAKLTSPFTNNLVIKTLIIFIIVISVDRSL